MGHSKAFLDQLKSLSEAVGELLNIDGNPFDTSGFDRGVIDKLKQLQGVLGNAVNNSAPSVGSSISGSVGNGGTNNSDDVRVVQTLLNSKGHNLTVDGQIGRQTIGAIEAFQKSIFNGWSDGTIEPGKNTWKALSEGSSTTTPTDGNNGGNTGPVDGSTTPVTDKSISGSVGNGGTNNKADVTTVQELLNLRGASLKVDGAIGRTTIGVIKVYQESVGVGADGLISPDGETWQALIGGKGNAGGKGNVPPGNNAGIEAVASRYGFAGDSYGNANDRAGIGNNANRLTQGKSVALSPELYDLLGLGYKSGAWINVEFPNGSVKKFQTADQTARGLRGLRVDFYDPQGQFKSVDGKKLYVTKVSSGGSQEPAPTTPTDGGSEEPTNTTTDGISASVGRGGTNNEADVTHIQELLNKAGAQLTVDGKIGNNTINAIENVQLRLGMNTPDGLIEPGKNTYKALVAGNVPEPAKPSGNYFSHPRANTVRISYGSNAVRLNANAEHLLKSVLAASGNSSATVTSSYRSYYHQARVMIQYYSVTEMERLYARGAEFGRLRRQAREDINEFARLLEQADKQTGRLVSLHVTGFAIDVVPGQNRSTYARKMQELVSVGGSGVSRFLPLGTAGEKVDHVEFTFRVV